MNESNCKFECAVLRVDRVLYDPFFPRCFVEASSLDGKFRRKFETNSTDLRVGDVFEAEFKHE